MSDGCQKLYWHAETLSKGLNVSKFLIRAVLQGNDIVKREIIGEPERVTYDFLDRTVKYDG